MIQVTETERFIESFFMQKIYGSFESASKINKHAFRIGSKNNFSIFSKFICIFTNDWF